MDEKIYSMEASRNLIGCLLNNPRVLLTSKYDITRDDFKPNLVHYRLMAVIENLASEGATDIDSMQVEQFIEPYEAIVELFKDNDTLEFIDVIKSIINGDDNIELYYNKVKKLSALREYRDSGFDIVEVFDERKDEIEQMKELDKKKLEDVINYFDLKNTKLRKKYSKRDSSTEYIPEASRMRSIIQSFKETPLQGACFQSPFLTTIMNGALRGHLSLRSGNSGSGKSTISGADLCELCATYIYNDDEDAWEENLNRQGGGLIIHTESDTELEVLPIYISYIAKVSRHKITKGKLSVEEEERVYRALDIIEESQIFFIYDPKFTESSIRESIKEYVDRYDIFVALFDYLQVNGVFNVKMMQELKTHIPDHQSLLLLAESLKHMAEDLNVHIMSGSQLNAKIKEVDFADEDCLSASKAVKNKIDGGYITTYPKPKEIKQTESYLDKSGFGEHLKPNRVTHVYKARFNSTGYDRIKIFQWVDLSIAKTVDLYCTNEYNELISVNKTVKAKYD